MIGADTDTGQKERGCRMQNVIVTRYVTQEAKDIRIAVFMQEQGFENEFDDIDARAFHVVVYRDGEPLGTGRLFTDDPLRRCWTVGRVAVLPKARKLHLGRAVLTALEEQAKAVGAYRIGLSAQCQARPFHEKCGYTAMGDIYMDEHCPHIHMEKVFRQE